MARAYILMATLLVGAVLSAGCGHVAPWERGRLAHRSMSPEAAASVGREHVQVVHEGATGGTALAESGCGCN